MTANRKLKRLVRKRMEETGENYTTALREVKAQQPKEEEQGSES